MKSAVGQTGGTFCNLLVTPLRHLLINPIAVAMVMVMVMVTVLPPLTVCFHGGALTATPLLPRFGGMDLVALR